jgi:hypothetical protein
MPAIEKPPVSISMTKVEGLTSANMGLWKQQKMVAKKIAKPEKVSVKKLPVAVSGEETAVKKPVKVFKL